MHTEPAPAPVAARLDHLPVTLLHCLAVTLCAFGFAVDIFEITLGTTLSAVFSAPPHATDPTSLSLLLAAVYVGAIVGAPLLGWLGDRVGRQRILMAALLCLAVTSLGAAFSSDVGQLGAWRLLSGLALGGYPPLMFTYLADLLPARRRGLFVLITVASASLGPVAGTFLVRALVPLQPLGLEAWRWGFVAGGLACATAGLLFAWLPESPRWLEARGRHAAAAAGYARLAGSRALMAPLAPLPVPPAAGAPIFDAGARRRWLLVSSLFFLTAWSTVAFPLLSGAVLAHKGFALRDTLLYVALAALGPVIGTLAASFGIDRLGRRSAYAATSLAAAACGLVFVSAQQPALLVASSLGFMLCATVSLSVLHLYASELFPTASRARAVASSWAVNRVGAACAPLLLLPLLESGGPFAMYGVIALAVGAGVALLPVAPPGRPRSALG